MDTGHTVNLRVGRSHVWNMRLQYAKRKHSIFSVFAAYRLSDGFSLHVNSSSSEIWGVKKIPLPNFLGRSKFYLVLLKKRNDTYERVKAVEFKIGETRKKVRVSGSLLNPTTKQYNLNVKDVSFSNDNRHYLFMDADNGKTLTFNHFSNGADPMDADTMNATGLVSAAMKIIGANFNLVVTVIAAIAGIAFGFIIGQNIDGIVGFISGGG